MDPLGLKKALNRRAQIAELIEQGNTPPTPVPPPGQGMPGQIPPQGGPPGMPPGMPPPGQMPPQMSQSQFARPFSPEERMRQAMLKAEALRKFGYQ